jgi:hypothetical protein
LREQLVGIDDRRRVLEFAELPEFLGGEFRLGRAAAAYDVDRADAAGRQRIERVRGDIGVLEFLLRLGQNARNVRGDVALSDNHGGFAGEVEHPIAIVGMAVVPADELRGRVAAGQVLAGDPECAIRLGAAGENHRMMGLPEFLDRYVAADGDVADEVEARGIRDACIDFDGLLELGMIGRDPAAHQPVGGGQAFEHVDRDGRAGLEQGFGGVETTRAAADDRDAQRVVRRERHECASEPELCLPRLCTRQRLHLVGAHRGFLGARCIDRDPFLLVRGQFRFFEDRLHRAFRDARAAVDADIGVDVQHVVVVVEALDGANRHAVGETAALAVICHYGGHVPLLLLTRGTAEADPQPFNYILYRSISPRLSSTASPHQRA